MRDWGLLHHASCLELLAASSPRAEKDIQLPDSGRVVILHCPPSSAPFPVSTKFFLYIISLFEELRKVLVHILRRPRLWTSHAILVPLHRALRSLAICLCARASERSALCTPPRRTSRSGGGGRYFRGHFVSKSRATRPRCLCCHSPPPLRFGYLSAVPFLLLLLLQPRPYTRGGGFSRSHFSATRANNGVVRIKHS